VIQTLIPQTLIGASLDLYYCRSSLVGRTFCDSLCHGFEILLGRCFASALIDSSYCARRSIYSGISLLSSTCENRSQRREGSAYDRPLLPHLPAAQTSSDVTGVHGPVVSEGDILNLLPTSFRGVPDFHPNLVGGCCCHLRFVLGVHWQHIHHLRICG